METTFLRKILFYSMMYAKTNKFKSVSKMKSLLLVEDIREEQTNAMQLDLNNSLEYLALTIFNIKVI